MKRQALTKIIASLLIVASALALSPIEASAEWKQDSNGWWNTERDSYSVGWKQIDGKWYYFDKNGYMKTGWILDGGKWYYLNSNGIMAKNTTIDGYYLSTDGAWTQNISVNSITTQGESNLEGVTMKTEKSVYELGIDEIKFYIINNTDKYIEVDEEHYSLERFENKKWCSVNGGHMDVDNVSGSGIVNGPAEGCALLTPPKDTGNDFISLNSYKGYLTPGKYRIVAKIKKLNASSFEELSSNGNDIVKEIKKLDVTAEFELR